MDCSGVFLIECQNVAKELAVCFAHFFPISEVDDEHAGAYYVFERRPSALESGAKSPEELSASLGMSEHAVTSLVSMLAQQGRVRIRLIEVVR